MTHMNSSAAILHSLHYALSINGKYISAQRDLFGIYSQLNMQLLTSNKNNETRVPISPNIIQGHYPK